MCLPNGSDTIIYAPIIRRRYFARFYKVSYRLINNNCQFQIDTQISFAIDGVLFVSYATIIKPLKLITL